MNYINDIPLYNMNESELDSVNVIIEICPGTNQKFELLDPYFNKLQVVRTVKSIYPFYYGSFPQTYAGDKDPLDFILFTDIEHKQLDVVKVDVIGAVKTIDAGEQDDKIICVECDSSLINVKKQLKEALKFLKSYKGKNSDMTINKKLASMSEADTLVKEAHEAWKDYIKPIPAKEYKKMLKNRSNTTNKQIESSNSQPTLVRVTRR